MRPLILVALFIACVGTRASAQEFPVPRVSQYVTDETHLLGAVFTDFIEKRLWEHEQKTTDQVILIILDELPAGAQLDSYSKYVFNTLGIGQKGKDNGVLILLTRKERSVRIELGKGVEKNRLTPAQASIIITAARSGLAHDLSAPATHTRGGGTASLVVTVIHHLDEHR